MPRPSIVLIVIDALRADCAPHAERSPHLAALGLERPHVSALGELVEGAFQFTEAIACAPSTRSAHASMFTGLLPPEHGARAFEAHALSKDVRTLAEILSAAGYATCAMSDEPLILQPAGLLRGFNVTTSEEDDALAWWIAYEGQPRFLFLHLWDMHKPYGVPVLNARQDSYPQLIAEWTARLAASGIPAPPTEGSFPHASAERGYIYTLQETWEDAAGERAALENYLAGLRVFDRDRLPRLLHRFRSAGILAAKNILVVTADHGEGRSRDPIFGYNEHVFNHGSLVLDDLLRIPLFIRAPALGPAATITTQVSQADIAPTLLDLVRLVHRRTPPRSAYYGRSLVPAMMGSIMAEQPAYSEVWHNYQPHGTDPTPLLFYRSLRYPSCKFRLVGKPFVITADLLALSRPAFIQALYRDLLGRLENPGELDLWEDGFQNPDLSEAMQRRLLARRFMTSSVFTNLDKYAIYDLMADPLELVPRDPRLDEDGWTRFGRQLQIMMDIERAARAGEPLQVGPSESDVVQQRLRDLGYVE